MIDLLLFLELNMLVDIESLMEFYEIYLVNAIVCSY